LKFFCKTFSIFRQKHSRYFFAFVLPFLSACTTYQELPLPERSPLVENLTQLDIDAAELSGLQTRQHRFNLADGLDLDEVGILAVLNNPDLKAKRAELDLAGAEAFAAGLLPDPQLSAALDRPTSEGADLVDAWSFGLGFDIISLISHQANVDASQSAQRKVQLDLLWQEWQVIQQARTLAIDLLLEQQRLELLHTILEQYRQRYDKSSKALANGNITLDVNGTDLTAVVDTLSQINDLERIHNQTLHDFDLLLGLKPGVKVELSPLPSYIPIPSQYLKAKLADIAQRRPDLLALRAGYDSQEAHVRAAILSQFPSFGITLNRARDTSAVYTTGIGVTLNLPLFSGNRGIIAVERATRTRLREEYQTRLAHAIIDVDRLRELQDIIHNQQEALDTYMPQLKVLVDRARRAYGHGDIDTLTFLNMESTWVNRRLEQISLVQAFWENRIALETLLALPDYPAVKHPDSTE
jgi:outer membrane protein, heavy metal efflux system